MRVIQYGLSLINGNIEKQIEVSNKIIKLLRDEVREDDFEEDLINTQAKILTAILNKIDTGISDFDKHLKEITPYTRLSQSELFTGSNTGISLDSEIRKEILSSDRICFLVSFIKWSGIVIFKKDHIQYL